MGRAVGAGPEAERGAGGPTVEVAADDDGAGGSATCQHRPELGALRVVRGHLIALVRGEVGGAHLDADSATHTQPLAPFGAGLCLERLAVGDLDGCLGEDRVTEQSAAARSDAG